MNLKSVLLICAAVTLAFAAAYMFAPAQTLRMLGYSTDSTGLLAMQFIGVLSMGYVAAIWQIRDADKEIQKPTLLSAFVAMGFAFLVSLVNQIAARSARWAGWAWVCLPWLSWLLAIIGSLRRKTLRKLSMRIFIDFCIK